MAPSCALLLIDVQIGFLDSIWGKRNNPQAEKNIRLLLKAFRGFALPIIHVHHLSREIHSPLRPGQIGAEPMEGCDPKLGERIFQKTVNSAFIGTNLEAHLREAGIGTLFMAGFTSDHCVSTSARTAANLGFQVTVITDATITFERRGLGSSYAADLVHEVHLASLKGEFAELRSTRQVEKLAHYRATRTVSERESDRPNSSTTRTV